MQAQSPILLRIFKEENVLEIWKKDNTQRYALLDTYEICKWSGKLGPKHKEGDRQAPEGFYHVTPALMNPNSSYHLSFNMGFPNTYDRANDRTGTHLMIHGACSSAGCYSMTDEYVEEIYALAREAFRGGQTAFQIQAFPFRMTPENMARKTAHPDFEFWKMLKEGSDHFEVTRKQPKVDVCEKRYVFNRYTADDVKFNSREICPPAEMPRSLALAFNEKQNKDQSAFDTILKRNASNPFVKPEERPTVLSASIKASATQGPLGILVPEPAAVTVSASDTPAVQTQPQVSPVSVEVSNAQDNVPETVQDNVPETAPETVLVPQTAPAVVPQQAQRPQPAS